MRKLVFVLVGVFALGLSACSSDDGAGSTGAETGTTGTQTGSTGSTSSGDCADLTGEGATFTITIADFAFDPNCFTASASQGITIVNQDDADHTFTIPERRSTSRSPPARLSTASRSRAPWSRGPTTSCARSTRR